MEATDAGALVKTVLVPVDGSPLAERAIGVAAGLATSVGADLRLFRLRSSWTCTRRCASFGTSRVDMACPVPRSRSRLGDPPLPR